MKEVKNVSVILPLHEVNDELKNYYKNAVLSVQQQDNYSFKELVVVVPSDSEVEEFVQSLDYGDLTVKVVKNAGETDFQTQFNLGVSEASSEWFVLLEVDDELAKTLLKNFVVYNEAYQNVDVFTPIVLDVDPLNNFMGFTNEAVWANGFSDELGYLDLNSLLAYQNFNVNGAFIKKSVFEEMGGFKKNIKLMFIYELLLRFAFNDVKIMVIPKFGYKHVNQRQNSLFVNYKETIDPTEAKWWLAQAKKEYYFKKDRSITYTA